MGTEISTIPKLRRVFYGTFALLPATAQEEDLGYATDTQTLYRWSGTSWAAVTEPSAGKAIYGDGSDGNITIAANTTLTRDMFYANLTIDATKTLNPNGYRIFVKGTLTNNGTIARTGNNGGAGGGASGSTAGIAGVAATALADGSLSGIVAAVAGAAGGGGGIQGAAGGRTGAAGVTGTAATAMAAGSTGVVGVQGADGGSYVGGAGGALGAAGTLTQETRFSHSLFATTIIINPRPGNGSTGGSGGGGDMNMAGYWGGGGGGSGGGGGNGGPMHIVAKTLINNGAISTSGGTGGAGGNGGNASADGACGRGAGGCGGTGGNAGIILLVCNVISNAGSILMPAGAGGAAGTNGTFGTTTNIGTPTAGPSGNVGYLIQIADM